MAGAKLLCATPVWAYAALVAQILHEKVSGDGYRVVIARQEL
jgi:hypothetical protein